MDWERVKKQWPCKHPKFLKILSIDGGGMRGTFPAQYLARIEEDSGRSLCDCFDLIVGTSTGGIIALGLAAGIPANVIKDLYVNEGKKIFKPRYPLLPPRARFAIGNVYSNEHLTKKLQDIFGELQMKDSKCMLCIPSIEHHKAKPKVYKTPHSFHLHIDQDVPMWQVALATSAAPYYFPPVCTTGTDCKIDGGLWANNPVIVGIAEAVKNGFGLSEIKVLSLGTGQNVYNVDNEVARKNSVISWGVDIAELALTTQSEGYLNTAKYLLGDNLKRVDFETRRKLTLDSADDEDIRELLHEANLAFEITFKSKAGIYSEFIADDI